MHAHKHTVIISLCSQGTSEIGIQHLENSTRTAHQGFKQLNWETITAQLANIRIHIHVHVCCQCRFTVSFDSFNVQIGLLGLHIIINYCKLVALNNDLPAVKSWNLCNTRERYCAAIKKKKKKVKRGVNILNFCRRRGKKRVLLSKSPIRQLTDGAAYWQGVFLKELGHFHQ